MINYRQQAEDRQTLVSGLESMSLVVSNDQVDSLLTYVDLIRQWGKTYNLVARGARGDLVKRHILDSLSMHSELPAGPLLDVGSGAGFPGLPLAILQPDRQVTLLDSNGKKVRFLSHVIRQLKLNNAQAVHRRAEDLDGAGEFAVITSRAFSTLETFVGSVRHLLVPETVLMAMKGRTPDDEITALPADILVDNVIPLSVPGLDAERHLAVLRLNTNNDNA